MHYVEIAQRTPSNRGVLIPQNELFKYINLNSALYRSAYIYNEEAVVFARKNGNTLKNYYGERSIDKVLIDIDKGQDTNEQTLQAANGGSEKTMGATGFIHIKNTGFTSSTKDTAVASGAYITIGMSASPAFATAGFTLFAGEAICLHGLGAGSDQFSQLSCDSNVAATYVEVVYLESSA